MRVSGRRGARVAQLSPAPPLQVMGRLVDAGFRVITSNDVFPEAMKTEDREIKAMVEYYVGFGANRCAAREGEVGKNKARVNEKGGGTHATGGWGLLSLPP